MNITKDGKIIAILFEAFEKEGTHPQTDPGFPLQLLMMKYPKGKVFDAHTHEPKERKTDFLQEAIVVTKGKLKVKVLTRTGEFVSEVTVSQGQCIFSVDGGCEVEVLEDAELYEFKTGPFIEDKVML